MTFGINSVERHFTNLKPEETKDGPVSINFQKLKELVDFSKLSMDDKLSSLKEENANWEIMKDINYTSLSDEELLNRDYYRGRFASSLSSQTIDKPSKKFIYNWEET